MTNLIYMPEESQLFIHDANSDKCINFENMIPIPTNDILSYRILYFKQLLTKNYKVIVRYFLTNQTSVQFCYLLTPNGDLLKQCQLEVPPSIVNPDLIPKPTPITTPIPKKEKLQLQPITPTFTPSFDEDEEEDNNQSCLSCCIFCTCGKKREYEHIKQFNTKNSAFTAKKTTIVEI